MWFVNFIIKNNIPKFLHDLIWKTDTGYEMK